jgi:hypothetical protein
MFLNSLATITVDGRRTGNCETFGNPGEPYARWLIQAVPVQARLAGPHSSRFEYRRPARDDSKLAPGATRGTSPVTSQAPEGRPSFSWIVRIGYEDIPPMRDCLTPTNVHSYRGTPSEPAGMTTLPWTCVRNRWAGGIDGLLGYFLPLNRSFAS